MLDSKMRNKLQEYIDRYDPNFPTWNTTSPSCYQRLSMYRTTGKQHPLVFWKNFYHRFFKIDLLHCTDNKGVLSHCIGSALAEIIVNDELKCGSRHLTLGTINDKLDQYYADSGEQNRVPEIRETNIFQGTPLLLFPQLHGTPFKAANTRALTPFMAQLCSEVYALVPSLHNQRRMELFAYFKEFYQIIDDNGEFFSQETSARFSKVIFRILARNSWLHTQSIQQGHLRWHIIPKHHYLWHLAILKGRNPRFYQTYIDESFVGRLCNVYKACLDGQYMSGVQLTVFQKYLLALSIEFSNWGLSVFLNAAHSITHTSKPTSQFININKILHVRLRCLFFSRLAWHQQEC